MLLAGKLYIPGVKRISNNAIHQKESIVKVLANTKKENYKMTYLKKELKLLTRTPSFFSNCVLSNLLWPIVIILIFLIQGQDNIIVEFVNHYKQQEKLGLLVVFISVFAISAILTTANSIASSSISREGNIMTYVVFSLTKISKEYQKAFKMLYTLQINTNPIDIDDRFANVDDMIVPGSINAATLDKISGVAGKEKTSGSHLRPSDPSLMEPKSSIAKSFDNLFSDVFQNDDEEDTKRTRKLPSWLDDI